MKKLPNKPSALIKVALADLYLAEKNPRIKINMSDWHVPQSREWGDNMDGCEVCLAGAVMLNSRESKGGTVDICPSDFDDKISVKLCMLDEFRRGSIGDGLSFMDLRMPTGLQYYREIVAYSKNPTKFKKQMRQLSYDLEKKGL